MTFQFGKQPHERVREMVRQALEAEEVDIVPRLTAVLDELLETIDADPELRRAVIRDSLRSAMISSFWLR